MKNTWGSRIGFVVLIGGFLLSISDLGVNPAAADPPIKESALAGVTQNWDKNLPSASRFTVLSAFGGAAVRDNNTGLVWEQAPSADLVIWRLGTSNCINKQVGNTVGWRLPSVAELSSLRDPTLPIPFVPTSVFTGVQDEYWTATTEAVAPSNAYIVGFNTFTVGDIDKGFLPGLHYWCVRGPMNTDTY